MTDDAYDQIRALDARRNLAMEHGDRAALLDILTEDFRQIHGDGSLDDRDGAIAAAVALPRRVAVPRDLRIDLLGEVAHVTGAVTLSLTMNGVEQEVRVFIGQLARLEGDRWRYFWSQVTLCQDLGHRPAKPD